MKKNRKKGFTLVEVIVVLVILAILAALMIPALTGWIDRANEKSAIVEARQYLLAAQTLASEDYANKVDPNNSTTTNDNIKKLAEVKGDGDAIKITGGKVESFTYTQAGNGKIVSYANGAFTVAT